MKTTVVLSAIAALGFAGAAVAQDEVQFSDIDTNGDAQLSLEEVHAVSPNVSEIEFTAYDADADGSLSEDEYQTWSDYKADQEPEAAPEAEMDDSQER